jgi:hypothetical protein
MSLIEATAVVLQYRCGMALSNDAVESQASAMQQIKSAPDMVAEMGR